MDKFALLKTVWVVSPKDAKRLVDVVFDAVREWNEANYAAPVRLEAVDWNQAIPETSEDGVQAAIDRQLEQRGIDLMVAVFNERLGTPVGTSESGSVHEIKRNIELGRPTWVYYCKTPDDKSNDPDELSRLKAFLLKLKKKYLIKPIESPSDLKNKLLSNFTQHMASYDPSSFNVSMALCNGLKAGQLVVDAHDFDFKPINISSEISYGYQVFSPQKTSTNNPYDPWKIVGTFEISERSLRVSKREIWKNMGMDPRNSFKFFVRVRNDDQERARCMQELVQADCVVTGYGDLDVDEDGRQTGLWRIWFLHQEGFVHPYLAKPYMANHSIVNLVSI